MSALVRCNEQLLNRHEWRRQHRHYTSLPPLDGDILRSMRYWRSVRRTSAHCDQQYSGHRATAMRPTLARLRMIEAAIRCDVACRTAVAAWRSAA